MCATRMLCWFRFRAYTCGAAASSALRPVPTDPNPAASSASRVAVMPAAPLSRLWLDAVEQPSQPVAFRAAAPQVYALNRNQQSIRVAHIAATYGTNGMPIPADAPWSVSLIDTATLIQQAIAAREAGADIVVASIHCCVEYVSDPTDRQEQIAAELAASGLIDLVIGHHANVPQPIAELPGGPRGEGMWVAYGLGNFISNQSAQCCTAATDSGLLLTATFRKPHDGPASVQSVEWSAVTVDRQGGYRVYPLSADVAAGSGAGEVSAADLAARYARVAAVVGTAATAVSY